MRAGIICLPRNNRGVGNYSWLIEVLLATFVGAPKFFLRTMRKKRHISVKPKKACLQHRINVYCLNLRFSVRETSSNTLAITRSIQQLASSYFITPLSNQKFAVVAICLCFTVQSICLLIGKQPLWHLEMRKSPCYMAPAAQSCMTSSKTMS